MALIVHCATCRREVQVAHALAVDVVWPVGIYVCPVHGYLISAVSY